MLRRSINGFSGTAGFQIRAPARIRAYGSYVSQT